MKKWLIVVVVAIGVSVLRFFSKQKAETNTDNQVAVQTNSFPSKQERPSITQPEIVASNSSQEGIEAFTELLGKPSYAHSERPMQRSELPTNFGATLPAGAKNIQYAAYSWWQAFEYACRYEATPEECIDHAIKLLTERKIKASDLIVTNFISGPIDFDASVSTVTSNGTMGKLNLNWFDLNKFSNGVKLGFKDWYGPKAWIDTNKGVLYYYDSD